MNPYIILGIVVVWMAGLYGVGRWQRQDGIAITEAVYAKRDNAALIEANGKIKGLEEKYRRAEQDATDNQAAISADYERKLKNANKKTADLIAAARAGTFRLRDPKAAGIPAIGSITAKASAGPGKCDGAGDGGLSADATEFLLALTGRCNTVRDKLTACQAIVVADRVACSGK